MKFCLICIYDIFTETFSNHIDIASLFISIRTETWIENKEKIYIAPAVIYIFYLSSIHKDELICCIFLWTPTHGPTIVCGAVYSSTLCGLENMLTVIHSTFSKELLRNKQSRNSFKKKWKHLKWNERSSLLCRWTVFKQCLPSVQSQNNHQMIESCLLSIKVDMVRIWQRHCCTIFRCS